jgi:hypothetical protein
LDYSPRVSDRDKKLVIVKAKAILGCGKFRASCVKLTEFSKLMLGESFLAWLEIGICAIRR